MATQHFKYQKTLAGFSIDYDPAKAFYVKHRSFIFQVSLGEMDIEDAFWVELGPNTLTSPSETFLTSLSLGANGNNRRFIQC